MPDEAPTHREEANQIRWGFMLAICAIGLGFLFVVLLVFNRWRFAEPPSPLTKSRGTPALFKRPAATLSDDAKKRINVSAPTVADPRPQPNAVADVARVTNPTELKGARAEVESSGKELIVPAIIPVGGNTDIPSGTVRGRVVLQGTPPPEKTIEMDATCGKLHDATVTTRHYVVSSEGGLANVFVFIKAGLRKKESSPLPPAPMLDQLGCMYEPYVMGVMTKQLFKIRNSDPFLHNVHATPRNSQEFNVGQPTQGQVTEKSFAFPEILVRLKCDVHPWMFAYLGVVDHPYFAVTDTNGVFQLPPNLPRGQYTLAAFHLKAGEQIQKFSMTDQQPTEVLLKFPVPRQP
jgi:hypothetical protein